MIDPLEGMHTRHDQLG